MRDAPVGIRPAAPTDAPGIARVHVESWRTTYAGLLPQPYLDALQVEDRERLWTRVLGLSEPDRADAVFVAEHLAAGIVGFVSGGVDRAEPERFDAELYAIYLLAAWQGLGVGKRLFETLVDGFRQAGRTSMRLWVAAGNPAKRFYERMGGVASGEKVAVIGGVDLREIAYVWSPLGPAPGGGPPAPP